MSLGSRLRTPVVCALAWLVLLGSKDCERERSNGDAAAGTGGSAGSAGRHEGHSAGQAAAGRSGGRAGSYAGGQAGAGAAGRASGAGGSHAGGKAGGAGSVSGAGGSQAGAAAAGALAAGGGAGAAGTAASTRCGTRGGASCADAEFCDLAPDSDCGANDLGGTCRAKPDVCSDIYMPVCGCDKRSYSSECEAHAAGAAVVHTGLCSPDECEAIGGYTLLSDGASVPQCAGDEEQWNLSGGREQVICCLPKKRGKTCGGIASLECSGAAQFCNYETAAGGQGCDGMVADAGGVCEDKPTACTRDYRPVCGCDRRTYGNACSAHAEGVSMVHDGACTTLDCAAVSGSVAYGTGSAPMCPSGTKMFTDVIESDGSIPIEGAYCCVK